MHGKVAFMQQTAGRSANMQYGEVLGRLWVLVLLIFKSWHRLCSLLNMKVAISIWNGRVAPVFDVSERCLLISPDDDTTTSECVSFTGDSSGEKARFLSSHSVHTLICGAISSEYEESLFGEDIEIVSFIAGSVETVLEAWKKGSLVATDFSMPGCGCPRRRCRRRHRGGALRL